MTTLEIFSNVFSNTSSLHQNSSILSKSHKSNKFVSLLIQTECCSQIIDPPTAPCTPTQQQTKLRPSQVLQMKRNKRVGQIHKQNLKRSQIIKKKQEQKWIDWKIVKQMFKLGIIYGGIIGSIGVYLWF